jgi:hypothetical protein
MRLCLGRREFYSRTRVAKRLAADETGWDGGYTIIPTTREAVICLRHCGLRHDRVSKATAE